MLTRRQYARVLVTDYRQLVIPGCICVRELCRRGDPDGFMRSTTRTLTGRQSSCGESRYKSAAAAMRACAGAVKSQPARRGAGG